MRHVGIREMGTKINAEDDERTIQRMTNSFRLKELLLHHLFSCLYMRDVSEAPP